MERRLRSVRGWQPGAARFLLYLRGVRQRTSLPCRIYHAATISGWSEQIGVGTFLPVIRIAERIGKCSYFCFGVCCWFSPGLWR